MNGPLNIYLKEKAYEEYGHGKKWEIWQYGGQYTEANVYTGRPVIIHKAKSKQSLKREIGQVIVGSLDDIVGEKDVFENGSKIEKADYHHFAPSIGSFHDLKIELKQLRFNLDGRFIAFEVKR
ncbi:hypothetical protein JXA85_05450 [Candidatus Woesearchaeota archaeon]|nr:hypothetical protein [Candidatus Woesearchaeota archaeon]